MIVSQKKENPWSLYCIYFSNAIHLFKLWNEIYCVVECRGKLFLGIFGSIVSYYRAEAWECRLWNAIFCVWHQCLTKCPGCCICSSLIPISYFSIWSFWVYSFTFSIVRLALCIHLPACCCFCLSAYREVECLSCVSLSGKKRKKLNVTWMYTIWISCCIWYFCIVIDFTLM